jgi:RNA polymerase sigma-70 factor (ECF subfamily)
VPADTPTDAQLVELALSQTDRARSAFHQLVLRHQYWLIRFLLHVLGDPGSADECGQESLVRAWIDLVRLRDRNQFKPWLRRIASRTAFNFRRAAKRRASYEAEAPHPLHSPAPDARIEADQVLLHVLRDLPYPYREVIVLRHIEDLSIEEIAMTLGIGKSAAKMRLARARAAFYELYDQLVGDDGTP